MSDLKKLTKVQLEKKGREYGVELDRRLSKSKLVAEVAKLEKKAAKAEKVKAPKAEPKKELSKGFNQVDKCPISGHSTSTQYWCVGGNIYEAPVDDWKNVQELAEEINGQMLLSPDETKYYIFK